MMCNECSKVIVGKVRRGMCDSCYHRARRRGFAGPPFVVERTPKHGTWAEYNRYGCRCVDCTYASLVAKNKTLETNRRKIKDGTWEGKHGTPYSARNLRCKCKMCVPVAQEIDRISWGKRTLRQSRAKSQDTIVFRSKINGHSVTITHRPRFDETGSWTCPHCDEVFTLDSVPSRRDAA